MRKPRLTAEVITSLTDVLVNAKPSKARAAGLAYLADLIAHFHSPEASQKRAAAVAKTINHRKQHQEGA